MVDKNCPFISTVTVSYRDDFYLRKLLRSIEKLDYPQSCQEVIVVSILAKKKHIKSNKIRVKQVLINRLVGYAEAVNIGISQSVGNYLFLPNPDIAIEKSAFTHLVPYLKKHHDVGIVGGKIFSMDNPEKISPNDLPCRNFDPITGKITPVLADEVAQVTQPQEFFWLCGNAVLLRKSVWKEVKKYDESYFLYWEDADFSMKVRRRGYKSVMIPNAKLFHKGSASIGVTDDQAYYAVRNGRYFMNKYTRLIGRFQIHMTNILLLISKKLQIIFGVSDALKSQAFIDGIIDYYKGKRGMRKKMSL